VKILVSKNGPTFCSSKEFQLFDKLRHEKGIYEYNLSENDVHTCNELRQRGLVLKVNNNGQTKYKIYPQETTN
jgi:hypothetical protein